MSDAGVEADLEEFIRDRMSMTHVYQPVVIRELLVRGGVATLGEVAGAVAAIDPARRAYYESTLKRYPRRVLGRHGIAELREGEWRLLVEPDERDALIALLDEMITEFVEGRPEAFRGWGGGGRVSAGRRYKVIEAHDGRCAACGKSAGDGVEVDVDHIVPKSLGGADTVDNLQLLCASCNRGKQASSTRDWRSEAVRARLGL